MWLDVRVGRGGGTWVGVELGVGFEVAGMVTCSKVTVWVGSGVLGSPDGVGVAAGPQPARATTRAKRQAP